MRPGSGPSDHWVLPSSCHHDSQRGRGPLWIPSRLLISYCPTWQRLTDPGLLSELWSQTYLINSLLERNALNTPLTNCYLVWISKFTLRFWKGFWDCKLRLVHKKTLFRRSQTQLLMVGDSWITLYIRPIFPYTLHRNISRECTIIRRHYVDCFYNKGPYVWVPREAKAP